MSPEEWNTVIILKTLLEPFYDATIQLQVQKFPTMAASKLIEKTLFSFFEEKCSDENNNNEERWLSQFCLENMKYHLVDKISDAQKESALVKTNINYFYFYVFKVFPAVEGGSFP